MCDINGNIGNSRISANENIRRYDIPRRADNFREHYEKNNGLGDEKMKYKIIAKIDTTKIVEVMKDMVKSDEFKDNHVVQEASKMLESGGNAEEALNTLINSLNNIAIKTNGAISIEVKELKRIKKNKTKTSVTTV